MTALGFLDGHYFIDFLVFLDILGIFLLAHLTEELLKIVLNTAFSLRFLDLMLIPLDQTPKMNHRT